MEVDEAFFLESFKGKRQMPRKSRERGGKAEMRALTEQIQVLIARDRQVAEVDAVLIGQVSRGRLAPIRTAGERTRLRRRLSQIRTVQRTTPDRSPLSS